MGDGKRDRTRGRLHRLATGTWGGTRTRLARAARTPPALFLGGLVLYAAIFLSLPGTDLAVSRPFWRAGEGFFLGGGTFFRFVYDLVPRLTWAAVLALLLLGLLVWLYRRPFGPFDRRTILFLLATIAIGPGLLTNTLFKDHWGRARPAQIVEFGGSARFSPPLIPTDQCDHNCSFPAGHPAMAFTFAALAFLPRRRRHRRILAAAGLAFGALVSFVRIAQGGHFLSDTIFAGFLVIGTAWLLHRWIVTRDLLGGPAARQFGRAVGASARTLALACGESWRWPWTRRAAWLALAALVIAASMLWVDRPLAYYFKAQDDRLVHWCIGLSRLGLGWVWLLPSGLAVLLLALAALAPRFGHLRTRLVAWAVVPAFIFLSVAASGLATNVVKILAGRLRPKLLFADEAFGFTGWSLRSDHWSFPSGHVTTVAGLAMALSLLWPRHVVAYWAFVALIALARIGATQHYLSDTVAAAVMGVVVVSLLRRFFARRGFEPAGLPRRLSEGRIPPAAALLSQRMTGRLTAWLAVRSVRRLGK